jgi:hypothetical protein
MSRKEPIIKESSYLQARGLKSRIFEVLDSGGDGSMRLNVASKFGKSKPGQKNILEYSKIQHPDIEIFKYNSLVLLLSNCCHRCCKPAVVRMANSGDSPTDFTRQRAMHPGNAIRCKV